MNKDLAKKMLNKLQHRDSQQVKGVIAAGEDNGEGREGKRVSVDDKKGEQPEDLTSCRQPQPTTSFVDPFATPPIPLAATLLESGYCQGCLMYSVGGFGHPSARHYCGRRVSGQKGEEQGIEWRRISDKVRVRQCPVIKQGGADAGHRKVV